MFREISTMTDKISDAIPYSVIRDLLDIMAQRDSEGNKPRGDKLKDIILNFAHENLKVIENGMSRQYSEVNIDLPQSTKDDVIIAVIAQYMAEDMQYAYDAEMDAKTVAITFDTPNAAGVSGYTDEVQSPGYKRQKAVDELNAFDLTNQTTFKGILDEQIQIDKKKGLVKADFKDNVSRGGSEGYFYGSHAERELSHRTDRPIGVSRRMCNECVNYFRSLKSLRIVADPDFIWIYEANGVIRVFTNNASKKQMKSKRRNFYRKYGKFPTPT